MSISVALHVIAVIIWVGGMFFAHQALRPAAVQVLDPPLRLNLWVQVFKRFFVWVWLSIITILVSGYWMVFGVFGGFGNVGIHIHIMHGLGIAMMLIYLYVFFAPYRRLRHAVVVEDFPEGGKQLAKIRVLVGINLSIGLITSMVAAAGRYL